MSNKCPGLEGTEDYAYGRNTNPPTKLQCNTIGFIEEYSNHVFGGKTSKQAYDFIGNYHTAAKKAQIDGYRIISVTDERGVVTIV